MQVATVSSCQEKVHLHKALLDFHGEVLLLMHWSILAYTGLVKIMKKYCKHTGKLIRAPAARHLLNQPFCSTEVRPVQSQPSVPPKPAACSIHGSRKARVSALKSIRTFLHCDTAH